MPGNEEKNTVILHLEDNPMDQKVVAKTLEAELENLRFITCENRDEFEAALREGGFDLLLADYQVPGFNDLEALELARRQCPDIPFIFLSGVLGEEAAIDSMRSGATDYVLKQRMERLVPAVQRALREAAEHRRLQEAESARRRVEERFRVFMDNLPGLACIKDTQRQWLWMNQRWADILPGPMEKYLGTDRDDFLPAITRTDAREIELNVLQTRLPAESTETFGPADDPDRQWLVTRFVIEQPGEEPHLGAVALDITDRVRAEQSLAEEKRCLQELVDRNLSLLAEQDQRLT